VACCWTKR